MSTAADYRGRNFDLLAFQGVTPSGEVQLSQELFSPGNSGKICAGVQKLAQAWLVEFLQDAGSVQFETDRGNDFIRKVTQGRYRTELEVIVGFKFAAIKAAAYLRSFETATTPNDERIQDVLLTGLTLSGDMVSLDIAILSMAGDTRTILLPIGVMPIFTG